jgi:predicted acylesterase/phospholipase RssA
MLAKLRQKKKIALVLSGGGIKAAAFHIGVCLALKEKGFKFAGGTKDQVRRAYSDDDPLTIRSYVGSSAGAFVAAILSSGHSLEALVNAFSVGVGQKPHYSDFDWDKLRPITYRDIFALNGSGLISSIPNAFLAKSLVRGGLEAFVKDKFKINGFFSTRKLEKYLREYALSHNEFRQLGVDLFVIGTQLNHTRKVIFGDFPETTKTERVKFVNYAKISEAVAASASLPPVYAPYGITNPESGKEMYFFDGEIRDTLSTHVAADHGADLVISSYSVQPYHYSDELGSLHKYGIPVIINQALYQVIQQKIDRHITHQQDFRAIYNAIDGYFKQNDLPVEHREKVLEIISNRVKYKPHVDYVYIHPRPQNHEMFFADHFSLNAEILERIVKIGFKSAISALRKYGS